MLLRPRSTTRTFNFVMSVSHLASFGPSTPAWALESHEIRSKTAVSAARALVRAQVLREDGAQRRVGAVHPTARRDAVGHVHDLVLETHFQILFIFIKAIEHT